jgi:effector-binding domain-containing protein
MMYDVDVVAVPEQAMVSLRGPTALAQIGGQMRRLRELVSQAGLTPAGPMTARFYGDGGDGLQAEYDVCLPVEPRPDGSVPDAIEEARGALLPLHHVLRAVHTGPHDSLQDAWRAVREAAGALGYTQAGPVTEVYVRGREAGVAPGDYITEVRLPYAR